VHEELADQEVHALYVVGLIVVARECSEDFSQLFVTYPSGFEVAVFWEGPIQISVNLLS